MRILALITARGGSKRISRKNIRPLGGRALIAWSIDSAKGIPAICDIVVSTDDPAIAEVSRAEGASVPWLRPDELATDTASSVDVCIDALNRYESTYGAVNGLLLLQPTSPFRSPDTVQRGIQLFTARGGRPVISMSRARSHPLWCFRIAGSAIHPYCAEGGLHVRSQDLPAAYVVNGALYLISPEDLRNRRSFFDGAVPLVVDDIEGIDIDDELDWAMAEGVLDWLTARRLAGREYFHGRAASSVT